jgi:predicted transposase/invertase (TIGR01784 family)
MLKYLIERSDIPREELFNTILEYLPKEESDMATVAEQLRHEGRQQGLQQGMQEGKLEAANKIARKLLLGGWSVAEVAKVTELSAEEIVLLQKQIR